MNALTRLKNILGNGLRLYLIADDPAPQLSRLDHLDGLSDESGYDQTGLCSAPRQSRS